MRKYLALLAALVAVGAIMAVSAFGAGNANSGPTVGDCISDGLYGNEPNMANGAPGGPAEQEPGTKGGNVVPTQSPGPFTNNPSDPDNPTPGNSVGDWGKFFGVPGAVPKLCQFLTG
jgi:hypothetical protein